MTATDAATPTTGATFSVVVPAHNRRATVERTLTSILRAADRLAATGGGETEVILVDDGSTDGTEAQARTVAGDDHRVQVLRQANAGASAARNTGARHGTGRYLIFLDCDDEADPDWLVQFTAALDRGARIAFAPARAVQGGTAARSWRPTERSAAFGGTEVIFNSGMFAMHRSDFAAVGGFAPALTYSETTELGLRIVQHLERHDALATEVLPDPLMTVQLPDHGGSNANSPTARLRSALYLLDVHAARLALDPVLPARYWSIAGVAAARLDDPRTARRCFVRAVIAEPTELRHAGRLLVAVVAPLRRRRWPAAAGTRPDPG